MKNEKIFGLRVVHQRPQAEQNARWLGGLGRSSAALMLALLVNLWLLAPLSAQDRVINGNFDQDLSGWTLFAGIGANVSAVWSPIDKDGNPASGSAELRDEDPGDSASQVIVSQCVDLTGAVYPLPWKVNAQVEIEGEPWLRASIVVVEHPGTQCDGGTLGAGFEREINFSDAAWRTISGDYTPLVESAGSINIQLLIQKPNGSGTGGFVRVDGISFGMTEDVIFADRFQSPP